MKKFFLPLILVALAAPVVIVSCSKTEETPATTTTSTSTSATSSTASTASTSTPGDTQSYTIGGDKSLILHTSCQQTGGSANTYFMTGFAASGNLITVTFHTEPTVAKTFTIAANGVLPTDTNHVQVVVKIENGSQTFTATGGTVTFDYDNGVKRARFSGVNFFKQGLGSKTGSASYSCQ